MKKAFVIVVVVIIAAATWLLIKNDKTVVHQNTPSTNSTSHSASQPNTAAPVKTDKVSMLNVAFTPANILVKKGTTVTWTNQDGVEHTVTENDDKKGPNAPPLSQGQSYTYTFNDTGTFHYHCSIHTEMSGTVTVTSG